jgi:hypothetical protein
VLLQYGFFKRGTEQKLVCAKDSGEIALVPILYGIVGGSLRFSLIVSISVTLVSTGGLTPQKHP